jgi:hypothetical protein
LDVLVAGETDDRDQTAIQHAKLAGLRKFWADARGDRPLPAWRPCQPEGFQPWFGHLIVLRVESMPQRYFVKLYGTQVVAYTGRDMTGKYLDAEVPESARARTLAPLDRCVRTAQPVYSRFMSALPQATGRPLHRLVLPFGAAASTVDVLLEAVYVEGWRYTGEFNVDELYEAGPLP